jgi:hypothetical protein
MRRSLAETPVGMATVTWSLAEEVLPVPMALSVTGVAAARDADKRTTPVTRRAITDFSLVDVLTGLGKFRPVLARYSLPGFAN